MPAGPNLPPYKTGDRPDSKRFNAFEKQAITEITVGPRMKMRRSGGSVALSVDDKASSPDRARLVTIIEAYHDDSEDGDFPYPLGTYIGSLSESIAGEKDCLVFDVNQENLAFAEDGADHGLPIIRPLPLQGVTTVGILIFDSYKVDFGDGPKSVPGINIGTPPVVRWRINRETGAIQGSYSWPRGQDDTDDRWTDLLPGSPLCDPPEDE